MMAESCDFSRVIGGQSQASDITRPGCGSGETTATPEKAPHAPVSKRSPASTASGFGQEDVDVNKSCPTPPTSSTSTTYYHLRTRKQSKLVYDAKYHPMDDAIRPTQAAKRREAHGEEQVGLDSDDSSEGSVIHIDAEESEDSYTEAQEGPKHVTKGKKRGPTQSRPVIEPTRRSSRKVPELKVSYDTSVHPQDAFLVLSSDEEELKSAKKPKSSKNEQLLNKPVSDDNAIASTSAKRKYADYVENSTSDSLDSDDEDGLSSLEAGADALVGTESFPAFPVAGNPQKGIRYATAIDTNSPSSGEPYNEDNEDVYPVQAGQPFNVFIESLSVQLASEAHAHSPLEYNDDDKENTTDNETDSDPLPTTEGISVMPEAQYRETSEERELSSHRALVSHALYDEPAPQTYGLDGTHYDGELGLLNGGDGTPEFIFESMKVLASGAHLPM